MAMTREQAWDLLSKYNKEPFHSLQRFVKRSA